MEYENLFISPSRRVWQIVVDQCDTWFGDQTCRSRARVDVIETTHTVRYIDSTCPFVWYNIPGAGTLKQLDWLYFNTQGLLSSTVL